MRNPRLYFTIEQWIFYPYRGQNSVLDSRYACNNRVIEETLKLMSRRQKDFIERNKYKSAVYVTDQYEFNSKTFVFTIIGIPNIANDD